MVDERMAAWVSAKSMIDAVGVIAEEMERCGADICCDIREGVVEISNESATYLVSWHEPSSQLWVASPNSGSVRFSYDRSTGLWQDDRTKQELLAFVGQEIRGIFGIFGT